MQGKAESIIEEICKNNHPKTLRDDLRKMADAYYLQNGAGTERDSVIFTFQILSIALEKIEKYNIETGKEYKTSVVKDIIAEIDTLRCTVRDSCRKKEECELTNT